MRHIHKRYIYSALFAGVMFIVTYAILNFEIIIAILLTFAFYIGGILLFKEDDMRKMTPENVNSYYFMASKLTSIANEVNNKSIIKNVNNIGELTDKILVSLSQRPKKVEQVFEFFDYYLDLSYKMLYKYKLLKIKKENTTKDQKFIDNIESYFDKIKEEFEKQYKNMQEAKILDINTEIKIFEKNIGITKNDVEGSGSDAN